MLAVRPVSNHPGATNHMRNRPYENSLAAIQKRATWTRTRKMTSYLRSPIRCFEQNDANFRRFCRLGVVSGLDFMASGVCPGHRRYSPTIARRLTPSGSVSGTLFFRFGDGRRVRGLDRPSYSVSTRIGGFLGKEPTPASSTISFDSGTHTLTSVPCPGSERMVNSPCTSLTRSFMLIIPSAGRDKPTSESNPTPLSWILR